MAVIMTLTYNVTAQLISSQIKICFKFALYTKIKFLLYFLTCDEGVLQQWSEIRPVVWEVAFALLVYKQFHFISKNSQISAGEPTPIVNKII